MAPKERSSKEKLQIVMEGLNGKTEINKLCTKYQIAQTQYDRWRDQLLQFGNEKYPEEIKRRLL